MFSCKVREFGRAAHYAVVNGHLYRKDDYFFYDENLRSVYPVDPDIYGIFFNNDGAWIEYKDAAGKVTAKHLSFDAWRVDATKNHTYFDGAVTIDENIYIVDGRGKDQKIILYRDNIEILTVSAFRMNRHLKAHGEFIYGYADQKIVCFDSELNSIWTLERDTTIISIYIGVDPSDQANAVLIVYFGSDSTCYGISAHRLDTGALLWMNPFDAKPSGLKNTEGKIYVCCSGRFMRLNAITGMLEVDQVLSFEEANGDCCSISSVVPIKNEIFCFYGQAKFFEVRTKDAKNLLQTIILPETMFMFPAEGDVLEYKGKYYLGLEHVVMWLNPMKSAQAVLTLDNTAPKDCEATFESRPPYTVEPIKDANGKNGFYIRMEGDDPDKIIRYANIVLKEHAYMYGKPSVVEFETRDHENTGAIILEISTNKLPSNKPLSEWTEIFSVVKVRTEDELLTSRVKAGDGESNFVIDLRVT